MTPEEFTTMASAMYQGNSYWVRYLAADMGVTERSVRRWSDGSVRVDDRTASHLRALSASRRIV